MVIECEYNYYDFGDKKEERFTIYEDPQGEEYLFLVENNQEKAKESIISSYVIDSNRFIKLLEQYSYNNIYYTDLGPNVEFKSSLSKIVMEGALEAITILRWLIEIIFPIKYLHDNNIYYHNLSGNNIILDNKGRLLLGPSNFPFSKYYEEDILDISKISIKYKQIQELPDISQDNFKKEIYGIFELWYELCTGYQYSLGKNEYGFELIESRFNSKWKILIEKALVKGIIQFDNFRELIGITFILYSV